MSDEHILSPENVDFDYDNPDRWLAVCSCGAECGWADSRDAAIERWNDHCDDIFFEATS